MPQELVDVDLLHVGGPPFLVGETWNVTPGIEDGVERLAGAGCTWGRPRLAGGRLLELQFGEVAEVELPGRASRTRWRCRPRASRDRACATRTPPWEYVGGSQSPSAAARCGHRRVEVRVGGGDTHTRGNAGEAGLGSLERCLQLVRLQRRSVLWQPFQREQQRLARLEWTSACEDRKLLRRRVPEGVRRLNGTGIRDLLP